MFVVVYWWRVKPGKEEQFREAWRRGTLEINRIYGSLGSRLHREADGRFVGIAEWPDQQTWERAFRAKMVYDDVDARRMFVDAIADAPADGRPLLTLQVTDDLLARTQP
jgi:heme-degrading monooxygenase HmoA